MIIDESRSRGEGDGNKKESSLSHIITGDFNATTWGGLVDEWCQTSSAWTLVDPAIPTITTGSSIDKMMLIPGTHIPSTIFPPDREDDGERGRETQPPNYPAVPLPEFALSSHFLALLQIPEESVEIAKAETKMILHSLTDEQ